MSDAEESTLSQLLDRLTAVDDESGPQTRLDGVAVSKGENSLHLSTAAGLVEIPVDAIEDVQPLGGHPNAVSVTLHDASGVRTWQPAGTRMGNRIGAIGIGGGIFGGFGGWGTLESPTWDYLDTPTVSGGRLDQTDDTYPTSKKDDEWV